jgi:hypothetical protein
LPFDLGNGVVLFVPSWKDRFFGDHSG